MDHRQYASFPVVIAAVQLDGSTVSCHYPTTELLTADFEPGTPFSTMPWWSGPTPDFYGLLKSAVAGQSTSASSVPYRSAIGETRSMELWVHPLKVSGESDAAVVITGTDTTSLHDHVNALTISETKFREMSHALPALVWMHDAQGRHEFANQTFCEFFDVTQEQLQGDKWQMLVHPEDSHYTEKFYQSVKHKTPFHSEVRAKNSSNEWRQLESYARPHFTEDNSFNGFVGVTVDITERKEAIKSLTDAARQKSTFLATLAHELRNPLLPILTGAELLQLDQSISKDGQNAIETIKRQASHLARLVDDILDVNRLDQGVFSIQPSVVCMQSVVTTVIDDLCKRITDKAHNVEVISTNESVQVWGDEVRLIQALTNVISNAIRCTPASGKLQVKITADESMCEVLVVDNGPGIKPDEIEHIFDLYYSTHTDSTRGEISLGIGLWLAKSILKKHGGDVVPIKKDYGSGATFKLTVPLATESQLSTAVSALKPVIGLQTGKPRRIVIVEDSDDVANTLANAVIHYGGVPHIESDADNVIDVIKSFDPDIVILDIGLPTISGIQAAQKIRAELGPDSPKLVALSGWSDDEHTKSANEAGFDIYLIKPVTLNEIGKLFADAGT